MLIKSRNFSPTKCERTWDEGGGLGWAPGSEKKFEGSGIKTNSPRYGKNWQLMTGKCATCDKYKGKYKGVGNHCKLPENERCQK